MSVYTKDGGYVPLVANLNGFWDKALRDLPVELQTLVNDRYNLFPWDGLSAAQRLQIANQKDQSDPALEPVLHAALAGFEDELAIELAAARNSREYFAESALNRLAEKLTMIVRIDRNLAGCEIKELRERHLDLEQVRAERDLLKSRLAKSTTEANTTERNTLLTIIAALCKSSGIDPQERGAAVRVAKLTDAIGAPVTDDTVRRVLGKVADALEARTPK